MHRDLPNGQLLRPECTAHSGQYARIQDEVTVHSPRTQDEVTFHSPRIRRIQDKNACI